MKCEYSNRLFSEGDHKPLEAARPIDRFRLLMHRLEIRRELGFEVKADRSSPFVTVHFVETVASNDRNLKQVGDNG